MFQNPKEGCKRIGFKGLPARTGFGVLGVQVLGSGMPEDQVEDS